jgi:hypothetical protein
MWLLAFRRNVLAPFSLLKMEAVYSSETLVTTYQTTRCHAPEEYNMNLHSHQNFEYRTFIITIACVTPVEN